MSFGRWLRSQRRTTVVRRAGDCPPYLQSPPSLRSYGKIENGQNSLAQVVNYQWTNFVFCRHLPIFSRLLTHYHFRQSFAFSVPSVCSGSNSPSSILNMPTRRGFQLPGSRVLQIFRAYGAGRWNKSDGALAPSPPPQRDLPESVLGGLRDGQ
jgi:hypothetical protein